MDRFEVYNKDQVYPEYLVLYERLHGTRPPEPPSKDMLFLLELPLYWKNVGKNPRVQETENGFTVLDAILNFMHFCEIIHNGTASYFTNSQEFHDHWLVRPKIQNLIYRMALHTSENSCPKARWCFAQPQRFSKLCRFNVPNELKIRSFGVNTSTGRSNWRKSWNWRRWKGALHPTQLGYQSIEWRKRIYIYTHTHLLLKG